MARKSILSRLRPSEDPGAAEQDPSEAEGHAANEPGLGCATTEPAMGTEPPGAEASAVIAEALSEAGEAAQKATEALAAEGVQVRARAPEAQTVSAPERPRKTTAQLIHAAQRERAFGRRLLARRTGGFASRLRKVRIDNGVLAAAFERFFPVIERCAYLVARHGGAALGDATAERLLARMREMAEELHADRAKELEAAEAYIGEQSVKMGERFITPEFTAPAFTLTVQLRTPLADRVLDVFLVSDQLLTEFETLYWNQLRTISDRNDEILRSKKILRPLFAFAAATTRNLYRRMKDQSGATPEEQQAAAEAVPARNELTGVAEEHGEAALAA